ncbi:pro-neuregulin-4, membrane-bound isoform-like isoform X2 [Narcine bancroftii]|uniref:pro-neuregulin-4, membrane-bound isoform-like isoform X2 n=1 Tax=Narcine bancroftii TaxID=1343680 RepID=UPI0038318263
MHGELCPDSYTSYCFNGGTCYLLISTPFCWCNDSFRGNRCEEFLLSSQRPERTGSSLLIIFMVATLLIVLLLIVWRTHFYCRKRRQKRRMLRGGKSWYRTVTRHRAVNIGETLVITFGTKEPEQELPTYPTHHWCVEMTGASNMSQDAL